MSHERRKMTIETAPPQGSRWEVIALAAAAVVILIALLLSR
jgi:hypothetical protein